MRQKNWRVAIVGGVLVVLAGVFFVFMLGLASKSNDPTALMQSVGMVSGVVGAIGIVMAIYGLIGRKV